MSRYSLEKEWQEILGAEFGRNKVIDARINETYAKLRKTERREEKHKKRVRRRVLIGAGSMAAAFLLMVMFCTMNPVLAREIPIFGNIFGKLAEVFSFGALPEEDTIVFPVQDEERLSGTSKDGELENQNVYQVKDGSLTVTLTEEYASNQAVYIGVRMEKDEGFPEIMAYEDGRTELQFMTSETYSFREDTLENNMRTVEGKFEDSHTFIGIMRIDYSDINADYSKYEQYCAENGSAALPALTEENLHEFMDYYEIPDTFGMGLKITQIIGYLEEPTRPEGMKSDEELAQMSDEDWESYMKSLPPEWDQFPNDYEHWHQEGSWDYEVTIMQKDKGSQRIEVNEINGQGIGVESIELSSVEMTVNIVGADIFAVVLDADGNWMESANDGAYVLPIEGHDISQITIYICDYTEYMNEIKGYAVSGEAEGKSFQEVLEERAVFKTSVTQDF
ncbi:hypothetical protein V1224_02790 [Lachnospiraceae bacterium JLR.KK008]